MSNVAEGGCRDKMKKTQQAKKNPNIAIIVIVCAVLALVLVIVAACLVISKADTSQRFVSETVGVRTYNDRNYYIIKGEYKGDYDLQFLKFGQQYWDSDLESTFAVKKVMNYEEYRSYCEKWKLETRYSDPTKEYIVFSYFTYGSPNLEAKLAGVEYDGDGVNIYIWDKASGLTADISAYVLTIPTDEAVNYINIIPAYTEAEFKNIQEYNTTEDPWSMSSDKPIIYLYPTEDTEVSVRLLKAENLTSTYPKYTGEWKVLAQPNGNLRDAMTDRQLYSLYYENKNSVDFKIKGEGFVVKGEDTAGFLEEKLATLGLTEREAEEFIIYWLPRLEANKYNYVRFATPDEINENMPLEITPTPDTIIRILMTFRGLNNPIEGIREQELSTPNRTGFVAVEWGGTEMR